jgi:ribokinase
MKHRDREKALDSGDTVLVVGSANMDLVVTCNRFPHPGETVFADSFATYPGGKGANQAVAAAKLAGEVLFVARLGVDSFGDDLEAHLRASGVSVDHLIRDDREPTGIAVISVDRNGQNEILVASGCNMTLSSDDLFVRGEAFDRAHVVLLQLEIPAQTVSTAVKLAHDKERTVVLNPAPATDLPDQLLRMVDYLTPNELEAAALSGTEITGIESARDAGRRLLDRGVRNVIITLGAVGALRMNQAEFQLVKAPSVEVADSTAAGDAFSGAFARALSWGWPDALAVEFAVRAASFSVTRPGAQPSLPNLTDLTPLLSSEMRARLSRRT